MLSSPQLGPQNSLCYVFCLQFCTLSTKRRAVVKGYMLLTLLVIAWFYFSQESISPQFLSGLEAEPVPGERHIIFLETLCVLSDFVRDSQSGLAITQREACAVASAANTNPDSKVYLLYTCSIIGNVGDSPEYVKQMLSYPNVRIWKLVISDYIKGTPLETWDFMAKVRSSKWPVVHASDILRIITLWKYGGTYLDMDFVIQKWVHFYRLQKKSSCQFILGKFLSGYISVVVVNKSRTGNSKHRFGRSRYRDPSRVALGLTLPSIKCR